MATNRIEEYLEAILAKIADGTDTTVPAPAWRIEEYLAAIYSALSSGGGGGGGLPEYTSDDDGKVLGLEPEGDPTTQTITVVQSQTVTFNGRGEGTLANGTYDFSKLSEGDTASMTVNGTTESVTVVKSNYGLYVESGFYRINSDGSVYGTVSATVSVTAEIAVQPVAPAWRRLGEVIPITDSNGNVILTWQEITDAMLDGNVCVALHGNSQAVNVEFIASTGLIGSSYTVWLTTDVDNPSLSASSADDYPEWNDT